MLGFAPIASVPLSTLPGINLYPYTLENTSYLYSLVFTTGPVSISVSTVDSTSTLYEIRAGLGFVTIYPDSIINSNNVYGVITYVFDKPATIFKTNIVTIKEPYNVVVNTTADKFIKTNALLLD